MVARHPEILRMPQPSWLFQHDAEQYAYDRCDEAVDSVRKDTYFQSRNIPEGHVHEEWTVEMMMDMDKRQARDAFYKVLDNQR